MYSEEARKDGLEGRIRLSTVVAEDGTAQNPRVIRGLGLDEMAIEAVRLWRFQPGTKEEKAGPRCRNGRWPLATAER